MNRGKQNWEHLNEELHVLITVEDTENRANIKIQRAVDEINKLLVPQQDGEDDLKKKQLMELAIINGTYRDNSSPAKNPRLINGMNHSVSINSQNGVNMMNSGMNTPSVVSSVANLAQTVQNGAPFQIQNQNNGYNFNNNVQIRQNQQNQAQNQQNGVNLTQIQNSQSLAQQQQLLGFAPVVARPQFVSQTFVAPAQLNSPGENNSNSQAISNQTQPTAAVYYQTTDQPAAANFTYTNFVPAAFYQSVDQNYIQQQQQQQQQQANLVQAQVQAQVSAASSSVVPVVETTLESSKNQGESADSKDAMVN